MLPYEDVSIDTVVDAVDTQRLFAVRGSIDGEYFSYTEEYDSTDAEQPESAKLFFRTDDFRLEAFEEDDPGSVQEVTQYEIDEDMLSLAELTMDDDSCVYQSPDRVEEDANRWQEHEQEMYGKANAIYRKVKQSIAKELWFKRREDALDDFL